VIGIHVGGPIVGVAAIVTWHSCVVACIAVSMQSGRMLRYFADMFEVHRLYCKYISRGDTDRITLAFARYALRHVFLVLNST
jgi:hypothetical protein